MRRSIIRVIYFGFIGVVLIGLILAYVIKDKDKQRYKQLNHFSYVDRYGNLTNTANLPLFDGYVIILFNPACEACHLTAQYISENIREFETFGILFLSPDSLSGIEIFMMEYELYDKCNVFFGKVEIDSVETYLGYSSIPRTYVYNANMDFIKSKNVFNWKELHSLLSPK